MKSAVVYYTPTGSTKKVADAIAEALPGEVTVATVDEAPSLDGFDVVFVGMPIHGETAPAQVRQFLEEKCGGRRVALFATHSAPEEPSIDNPVDKWLKNCRDAASGAEVIGLFNCQGKYRGLMGSQEQPDASRLEKARKFAKEIAAQV